MKILHLNGMAYVYERAHQKKKKNVHNLKKKRELFFRKLQYTDQFYHILHVSLFSLKRYEIFSFPFMLSLININLLDVNFLFIDPFIEPAIDPSVHPSFIYQ